jgi:hypothetical protein
MAHEIFSQAFSSSILLGTSPMPSLSSTKLIETCHISIDANPMLDCVQPSDVVGKVNQAHNA